MDPRDARNVALGALAIVALALIAATLPSTVTTGGMGGEGGLSGTGDEGLLPSPPTPAPPPPPLRIPYLAEAIAALAIIVAVAAVISLLVHWREAIVLTLLLAAGVAIVWAIVQVLARTTEGYPLPDLFRGNGSVFGSPGNPEAVVPATPPIVLLLAVAVVVIGAVVAFVTRGQPAEPDVADGDEAPDEPAAVGRAAGRAADRIEADRDAANEVYRAWHEMTELLEVPSRHAATPGEFADAAVDAGMARGDVAELTTLFEDVRYGGRAVTATEERRAVETFRRIEAAYAGEPS